jgi:GAF domain-containing protein
VTGPPEDLSAPGTRAALDGLARLLLTEEDTQSLLQRVVDLVQQVMPEGAEASITVIRGRKATTAAFSGALALQLDEAQYRQGYGPCVEAALGGHLIEITDGRAEGRWPEYMPTFLACGALSSLAVPVSAAQWVAGLNVYAPAAGAFTDAHRHAAREFAGYAAVALTNMLALQDARHQAEQLRTAMESRAVIEQAKGILIERYKVTADQAFRLLVKVSMHTNRKLRDLAEDLVVTGDLNPWPPDPQPSTADDPSPVTRAAHPGREDR